MMEITLLCLKRDEFLFLLFLFSHEYLMPLRIVKLVSGSSLDIHQNKIHLSIQWSELSFLIKVFIQEIENSSSNDEIFLEKMTKFQMVWWSGHQVDYLKNSSIWYSFFTLSFFNFPKDIDLEYVMKWNVIHNE